jgi:Zn-dependent membrane protease YugP
VAPETADQLALNPLEVTEVAAEVVGALSWEVVVLFEVELVLVPVEFTARRRAW